MHKFETLKEFLQKNSHLSVQGSEEWHNARSKIIGSSEISVLLGKNQYMDENKLAMSKLGLHEIDDMFPIMWGNIFEDIINYCVSQIMETEIHTSGSIKGYEYKNRIINATSPDGLGIITNNVLSKHIADGRIIDNRIKKHNEEFYYVLFEYKAPAIRCPKDEPKEMYIPQIMSGMNTCGAEMALFCDALIRPCSPEQFKFNHEVTDKFNNPYGNVRMPICEPLYMGYLIFYEDGDYMDVETEIDRIYDIVINDENITEFIYNLHIPDLIKFIRYLKSYNLDTKSIYKLCNRLIENEKLRIVKSLKTYNDILLVALQTYNAMEDEISISDILMLSDRKLPSDTFKEYFTNCIIDNPDGHYNVYYSQLINKEILQKPFGNIQDAYNWLICDSSEQIRKIKKEGGKPLAILPYKILDIKMNLFNNDPDYVKNIAHDLYDFLNRLDKCKEDITDNMDYFDKVNIVNKHFPVKPKKPRKTKKEKMEDEIDDIIDELI